MSEILSEYLDTFFVAYLDDILVFSKKASNTRTKRDLNLRQARWRERLAN
jgi:hypothetical protein